MPEGNNTVDRCHSCEYDDVAGDLMCTGCSPPDYSHYYPCGGWLKGNGGDANEANKEV